MSGVQRPSGKPVTLADVFEHFEAIYSAVAGLGIPVHVALSTMTVIVARYLQAEGYPLDETLALLESLVREAYKLPVVDEPLPWVGS